MKRGKGRKKIKRGIYILPSIFTSLSLFSGFYSITAALSGNFIQASWALIIAALFDAADGRIARLTRSVSKFGEHYDSLVDMISFGATPAILVYTWALKPFGRWGWLAAFLYIICVALRLARFNLQSSSSENKYFQGLPSPPSAVMLAATVILFTRFTFDDALTVIIPLITAVLALLMVSNLRYYSFKDVDFRRRRPFNVLVALILLLILFLAEPEILLFAATAFYILSGPVVFLFKARKKKMQKEILEESEQY